jgi:chromosome segregation ATPase
MPTKSSRAHSTSPSTAAHAANDSFESDDDDIDATPHTAPHVFKPPLAATSSREKELRMRAEVAEMALKEVQDKHAKLSSEHEALKKAHETMRLDLDSAKRQAQRLKTKDEQETSTLNDMVEKIEQNLLNATQRAQTAEARVAELERQLGRDRDAADQAQIDALGDEESRQLLKLYRGRLRMCQESGADAAARLARTMQVVLGAMKQIQSQSGDMQVIVDTMKTFGRVALLDDGNDRF